jgi:NAD(P)H dehydrogenase (quinone)
MPVPDFIPARIYIGFNMQVLITGASGKTGKAIIKSLLKQSVDITALIHRTQSVPEMKKLGVDNIVVGDLQDINQMKLALRGVDCIYLIISNMNPDEKAICSGIINLCKSLKVNRIIYHSVLHAQVSTMPHHWQKMQVEELLFTSSLDYTILQPTAYMQNILGYKDSINSGIYPIPYPISSKISLVDLSDVADVASKIITESNHLYAIYELVGTFPLSQIEVAEKLSYYLNKNVLPKELTIHDWENSPAIKNMPEFTKNTLKSMFHYYAEHGLAGNNHVLSWLLGRAPNTLEQFLKRDYSVTH